jgi:uncharacterized protein (DUF885 family)
VRRPITPIVRTVLLAIAVITAVQSDSAAQTQTEAPKFSGPSSQSLHQLWNDYWEWRLVEEPELATSVGRPHVNDRWRDLSKAARDRARATRQENLERSLILSPGTLTPADYLSAILWEYELRDGIEAQDYLDLVQTVSQIDGAHNRVFRIIEQMPAATLHDYENVLGRLAALPHHVDQVVALLDEQLDAGLARPTIVVDLMLEQMTAQRSLTALESPLLRAFGHFPEDMAGTTQRRLRTQAVAAYTQQFVPSWTRLEQYLRDRYRPRAAQAIGLSSLPSGPAIYARLVRYFTSTKMSPDEIHQLGLKEVARIEGEMRVIADEYGFTGSLNEFARDLASRPGMRFESEDEMLAYAEDVLTSVRPRLSTLFLHAPRTELRIRPIPADRASSTPSSYSAGAANGSRPAFFNMNTYRPTEQVKYTVEALVLHETVPGHHLQVGLARELENLPTFRTAFRSAAFSEGWGLYAESLGTALGGVYRDAPTRFGRLASEQFRAVRLVVDTGIHAKGWSREQAQAYFREHAPSQSLAEVDRYIALPGQALAYKIGELRIQALRRRAEQALGTRFDVRAFHDAILRNGSLPLEILEEQVTAYIAQAGR